MKKLFYPMFALATMAMTTSCSDELENGAVSNGNEATVSFKVQLENEVGSRAVNGKEAGNGSKATELHYAVYKVEKNADGSIAAKIGDEIEALRGTATVDNLAASVNLTLVKGQTYNFMFWAQTPNTTYYTVNYTEGTIKVNYTDADESEEGTKWEQAANDENRDAFFNVRKNLKIDGPIEETITLKRPFAQINVGTTIGSLKDAYTAEVDITKSSFKIDNVATTLNTYSGAVSDPVEITYTKANIIEAKEINAEGAYVCDEDGDLVNVDNNNYEYLALNYILVNDANTTDGTNADGSKKAIVNAEFKIFDKNDVEINTFEIPNLPVQRNWRTNIIGDIMNESVTFNIVVDPNFDNSYNYSVKKQLAYIAANGGEITLTEDVKTSEAFVVENGSIMNVNLNGYSIIAENGADAFVVNDGTLNIKGEGKVTTEDKTAGYAVFVDGPTAVANIYGGTYTIGLDDLTTNEEAKASNSAVYTKNGGKANIYGGTFQVSTTQTVQEAVNKTRFLINENDANRGTIAIYGGSFVDFDPANNLAEGEGTNFVQYGYKSVEDATTSTWTVVENELEQATLKGGTFALTQDMTLNRPLTVEKNMVLKLEGKTIKNVKENAQTDVIIVKAGATLTIEGDGIIEAVSGNDGYAVIADGTVIIKGGTFKSGKDANGEPNAVVYARGNGKVYVTGGYFPNENNSTYVLNKKDADRATAIIEVTGGEFVGFDPANNAAEGKKTNFVVVGYESALKAGTTNTYVVSKKN